MTAAATRALPDHGAKTRATRVAGHAKGCNCENGCAPLNARYQKQRAVAQHRGTWQPLTDATPHLTAVRGYRDAAWTNAQIAAVTGLNARLVRTLLGENADVPPPAKLRSGTIRALRRLAGANRLDAAVPDRTLIDATGTRRQIEALAAIGWSQRSLPPVIGRAPDLTLVQTVTAGVARRIAAVYADLSATPGPSRTAAVRARRKGWVVPAGWDDLDLFDPRTIPHDLTPRDRTPEELVEDAEYIRRTTGADWDVVAGRLQVRVNTLHTYRSRIADRERVAASAASEPI